MAADHPSAGPSKAERRAARAAVGAYHEAELAGLIEHVRERATQKLWSFCTLGGATARTLEWMRDERELPDWWEQTRPRRARE